MKNHPVKELHIQTTSPYIVRLQDTGLASIGPYFHQVIGPCKVCIVSDTTVAPLYRSQVAAALTAEGYCPEFIVFPPGETTKGIDCLSQLLEFLAIHEFTRKDVLVALGGGVIGDLTGFAAATYLRGIRFVQLPTTLLAAVDSSVGGKTGINLSSGKNLAGAFWQPALVIFDQETLTTLQPTSILDGLAEMIKCAMIADKQLFDQLGQLNPKDLPKGLLPLIGKTVEIKQKLVEEDERDTGSRQLLNFGHTLGHAIELCSNYEISHGHGVAIGMKVFTSAAAARGYTTKDCKEQLIHLLTHFDFPLACDFSAEALVPATLRDKKRGGEEITIVIPKEVGNGVLKKIPVSLLTELIKEGLK